MDLSQQTLFTLVFVRRGDEVLLGWKKRAFAAGTWNGFGGKYAPNETARQCARRELEEESKILLDEQNFRNVGTLLIQRFHDTAATPAKERIVHLFIVNCDSLDYHVTAMETDEMKPKWFPITQLPFDDMLPDAQIWLPTLFKGHHLKVFKTENSHGNMTDCVTQIVVTN